MNIRKINSYHVYIHTVNALKRVCELQLCLNTVFHPVCRAFFFFYKKMAMAYFPLFAQQGKGNVNKCNRI